MVSDRQQWLCETCSTLSPCISHGRLTKSVWRFRQPGTQTRWWGGISSRTTRLRLPKSFVNMILRAHAWCCSHRLHLTLTSRGSKRTHQAPMEQRDRSSRPTAPSSTRSRWTSHTNGWAIWQKMWWCKNQKLTSFPAGWTARQLSPMPRTLGSSTDLGLSCPRWLQKGLLPIFKNTKKYEKNTTQKYKIRTAGFGKYNWLVLYFFCILVPDFQKWTRGWLSGLFLNLSFLCILYFWNFGFVFFFCILYFWNFGFVFFFCILYFCYCWFVFFFCILYFWAIAFVFFGIFCNFPFFGKQTKKIRKIQITYKKYTLYFCIFFCIFPLRPKMQFVFLYFFCIFPVLHRLHFVLLYFFVL